MGLGRPAFRPLRFGPLGVPPGAWRVLQRLVAIPPGTLVLDPCAAGPITRTTLQAGGLRVVANALYAHVDAEWYGNPQDEAQWARWAAECGVETFPWVITELPIHPMRAQILTHALAWADSVAVVCILSVLSTGGVYRIRTTRTPSGLIHMPGYYLGHRRTANWVIWTPTPCQPPIQSIPLTRDDLWTLDESEIHAQSPSA